MTQSRRELLRRAPAAALAAAFGHAQPRRPQNVLFLLADDQRADTIAALGNEHIRTPNLDALARSGTVFSNAYCMGGNSAAVCLPSRNMILSGRAFFRYGRFAPGDAPNFPDSMKQAGYFTYHHGKRGNSAIEIQKRFDIDRNVDEHAGRKAGEPGREIVDGAIRFLEERKADRPFFLYLAFEAPHDPRVAAKRYLDMYERAEIPLPPNYLPVHPFDNGEMTVRDELLAGWPRTPAEIRRHLHDYYGVITALDEQIGRLLGFLGRLDLLQNTLIVFSSDQGLAIGSHGLMGKQSLYDHSMKSPLILAGPGIPPGLSGALVYLMDIYPTVLELAGAAIPEGLDGRSLKPVLDGNAAGVRDTLFTAYRDVQRAVRDSRWKLIRYPQINRTQLFDLAADPAETRDLSEDPSQADRIRDMLAWIARWQGEVGDKTPLATASPGDGRFSPPAGEALETLRRQWKM